MTGNARIAIGAQLLAAVLMTACQTNEPLTPVRTAGPEQSLVALRMEAQAEIAAAAQGRRQRGFEDDLLSLEARVPEVGGAYLNVDGEFVLLLTDIAQRSAAESHLRVLAKEWAIPQGLRDRLSTGQFSVSAARYPFSSLVVWQRALSADMSSAGMIMLDADEATNRVIVGVTSLASERTVRAAAVRAGVPVEAITVRQVDAPRSTSTFLTDAVRPTGGGFQVTTTVATCSLGWNVRSDAGVQGFVTAAHCIGKASMFAGATGEPFYQPNSIYHTIGTTTGSRPFNLSQPDCGGYSHCATSDAVFVRYFTSSNGAKRLAHTTYLGENSAPGSLILSAGAPWYNTIQSYGVFMIGQSVDKVGRTTGWTRGTLSQTCADMVIDQKSSDPYMILCAAVVVNAGVGYGDSGAPVWLAVGGTTDTVTPLGILFAASIPEGSETCSQSCYYLFTSFERMGTHLIDDFHPESP